MKFNVNHFNTRGESNAHYFDFSPLAWAREAQPSLMWEEGGEGEALSLVMSPHIGGVRVTLTKKSIAERLLRGCDAKLNKIELRIQVLILSTAEWKTLWEGRGIAPYSSHAGGLSYQLSLYSDDLSPRMARRLEHTLLMYGVVG